jgi:hypothetical protein
VPAVLYKVMVVVLLAIMATPGVVTCAVLSIVLSDVAPHWKDATVAEVMGASIENEVELLVPRDV